ncbi:DUF602-domain-containing protein [Viridothelium virens]|uniref:DUF602-domain-containing protein n=1 Tax=Viridothelium virens TaxID=1048519 RepID=A0A6A6H949_VIRVR|nr:DUF602-domain-containing protein [Viridothelium virens]
MGNDGGSIPSRRELVKEAARNPSATELKESQHSQQEYYWTTDPLSQKPLAAPIVSDCNGKLYNKDSIIEHLLPSEDEVKKSEAEDVLQGAVNSLKDVVDVKFTVDPSLEGEMTGSTKIAQWICPITNERLGAGAKAVYVVPCGHAFSANAVKEVSGELCMTCNSPYASNDVVPILPTAEIDIARLSLRIRDLQARGLSHSLKKAVGNKKRKKVAEATELKKDGDMVPRTASPAHKSRDVGIKNASTASLTAKVMEEQDLRNKRRKHEGNNNLKGLFSARDSTRSSGANSDFMTRGFSIPANDKR